MPPQGETRNGTRTPLSDHIHRWFEGQKSQKGGLTKNGFATALTEAAAEASGDTSRAFYPQWLESLMAGRGSMPELWRLEALASVTGTDVELLKRLAAQQWLRLDVIEAAAPSGDVIIIPVRPGTSEATRRRIQRMAQALAEEDE